MKLCMDKEVAHAVWTVLVECAGASRSPDERESFVYHQAESEHRPTEWRFCGVMGFGGKFWNNADRWYITCYPEDQTATRMRVQAEVNARLAELLREFRERVEKHDA